MAKTYIPNDPLFAQQWHLLNNGQDIYDLPQVPGAYRNDINVTEVWPDYTGKGIVVGVYDNGFQGDHPDYIANYLSDKAYDFVSDRPGQTLNDHGTSTLGLIVAADNDIGGVGVAFDAKAIAYTWGAGDDFARAVARALLDGVQVSSNSWGPSSAPFSLDQGSINSYSNSFINLAQLGRDGLGIVTVFAAGNSRQEHYNSTFLPTSNSPFAITVAAANVDGTVSSYSNPGPSVLVAAPGSGANPNGTVTDLPSIVTTDMLGEAGYNTYPDGDYTNVLDRTVIDPVTQKIKAGGFNGTSAATPIVSGVVALILEANASLGYRDVQEILAYSAKTPEGVANWATNGATDWNGGGHYYNNDLGFGHVDALAAVRLAETWHKQSTYSNAAGEGVVLATSGTTVQAGNTQEFTAHFQNPIRVQHVVVSVSLEMFGGTLSQVDMMLIGPNGETSSVFLDPDLYNPVYYNPVTQTATVGLPSAINYSFDTVHDWGELSTSGDWKLVITNRSNVGDLVISANLQVLGDTAPESQTFIYTNDYAQAAAADASRAVVGANTVGSHALNAAAVTSDTIIDLVHRTATIAGVATTISDTIQLSTLVTGDGNDVLVGDAFDNLFLSGRGINTITGGGGVDTLQLLKGIADYTQMQTGAQIVLAGGASQDHISGVSKLLFAEGTLTLGTNVLVNDVFYANANRDVLASGMDTDTHYATYGWHEGRDPNAWFSTTAYLANHANVVAAGSNPLDYYDQVGWKNGDDPSAWFDTSLYLKLNPDVAAAGIDPLAHYLAYGMAEDRQIRPVVDSAKLVSGVFDPTFYKLANVDVAQSGMDAYAHYLQFGRAEGRDPDAYFDTSFYLAMNPDVAQAGVDPLQHYLNYGWKEGRDPSSQFDTLDYLATYKDVAEAGIDPLVHYLQYGIAEGRHATWDLA
ncbi:S8 family serine peptidase [Xanthobacter sp. VNH20]|uniref:S8 family peptidase n=1 Tax=Xanthobacter sp. VNH20 TaxID=3156616 RepID=UPI0032B489AF